MDRREFLKTTAAAAVGGSLESDRALGMDQKITRQDHISRPQHPMLSAQDWDGFSGVGDYLGSNGNTHKVMSAGHGIRDGLYDVSLHQQHIAEETYDCVVIGGGISGLAAAQAFTQKSPGKTCLVLENHDIFGGEARRNEFDVDGHRLIAPQGSAMFFPPLPGSSLLAFYNSIGFDGKALHYQQAGGGAEATRPAQTSYAGSGKNLGMYFGQRFGHPEGLWLIDPYGKQLEGAPFPEDVKRELLARPRRIPELEPKTLGDSASLALDRMTQEDYMMQRSGLRRETIRTWMPYAGSAAGASADAISAFADIAPDLMFPWDRGQGSQMFPGGNTGIARFQVKALVPDALPGPLTLDGVCHASIHFKALDRPHQPVRIRLGSTVFAVRHEGDAHAAAAVSILYMHDGRRHRIRARSVVMAGGWPTWRVVQDLPDAQRDAYQQFFRMPCLVANIALTNWRFLAKAGISQCKWYEGLGESFAIRRMPVFGADSAPLTPDSPTVITLKIYFTDPGLPLPQQGANGRLKLLNTPFSEYERSLREQFSAMFARWGFDARRDIAGIILNRWGHAYLCAQPGFFFGLDGKPAPREVLRSAPFHRIAFANSDLSGIMDHRASIDEAQRAVDQLPA